MHVTLHEVCSTHLCAESIAIWQTWPDKEDHIGRVWLGLIVSGVG